MGEEYAALYQQAIRRQRAIETEATTGEPLSAAAAAAQHIGG